jgi:hypothetical protein
MNRHSSPDTHRHQNEPDDQKKIPGDTDAADIVGRTGEEMPEVAHDSGNGEHPQDNSTPDVHRERAES